MEVFGIKIDLVGVRSVGRSVMRVTRDITKRVTFDFSKANIKHDNFISITFTITQYIHHSVSREGGDLP